MATQIKIETEIATETATETVSERVRGERRISRAAQVDVCSVLRLVLRALRARLR